VTQTLDVVFLGPPGAGKGTQASGFAECHGVPHVSTGDLFREHLKNETPVGLMAKEFMDRGGLVPDDVVCQMVRERLEESDADRGAVLDGFPRTVPQAEVLAGDLERMERALRAVVHFSIQDQLLVERLAGRLTCRGCGAVFHRKSNPPRVEGICDPCGGDLYTRDDDGEETVRSRLQTYRDATAPLLGWYEKQGLICEIDADRSIDAVRTALEKAVEGR